MPERIERNDKHQLHCTDNYAIEWSDGYKLAYLSGVYIDYELFEKFKNKTLTFKEIMGVRNIEQRYALLKEYDKKELLAKSDTELISNTSKGNKLFAVKGVVEGKVAKLLTYYCPSTGREYFKWVPYEFECADGAQAWSHHMSKEDYLVMNVES